MAPTRWWHFSSHLVLSDHEDRLMDVRFSVEFAVLGVRLPGMVILHRGEGQRSRPRLSPCWIMTLDLLFGCTRCTFTLKDLENPSIHTIAALKVKKKTVYTSRISGWTPPTVAEARSS